MPEGSQQPGIKEEDFAAEARAEAGVKEPERKLYGTFAGVFTPTLLTILGVIMYLREGWVVGNAGLLGAWLIIGLAFGITACTGLALSSITTNIRIGAGGAFNVISQSLGLEVGGSIGIPLYVSQALAVAMYIFGFRAGWTWVFPGHPALVVDLLAFAALFGIAFISAGLAFRVQYVILAVIVASLASVAWAAAGGSMTHDFAWWGGFAGSPETGFAGIGFWGVFAVFFPASTGIMAGANMSGDLKNPRKSIPIGTMSAIGLSLAVYLALAWWLAASATTKELLNNYTVMIDKAAWGPAVAAGLLGATFSSALASLVGAPRILQALADHDILPLSGVLAKRTAQGEPRNALFLTGAIVLAALMLRDLNAVAPLITMFFLLTYLMINVVVLMEQSLRLVSFRPLLRVPRLVPLLGAAGCLLGMLVVNALMSVLAVAAVLALHAWLVRRHLTSPYSDVRSGLFTAMAEWAAKKARGIAASRERTWKANLLSPVELPGQARNLFGLLRDIARPKGFVRLLGLTGKRDYDELTTELAEMAERYQREGVFASWTVVRAASFSENLAAGFEALGSAFFTSNVLLLHLYEDKDRDDEVRRIIAAAREYGTGVLLFAGEAAEPFQSQGPVAVWLDKPEHGWRLRPELGNVDLALLTGYKLARNWDSPLEIIARVEGDEAQAAQDFVEAVKEMARMPQATAHTTARGGEQDKARELGAAVHITSLDPEPDLDALRQRRQRLGGPCLYALDSGRESVLA